MDIDIRNLIYQLVPPHKRLPTRLAWLSALLAPLADLWVSFCTWRANTRMMVNVNSQMAVLEGYLRKKYDQPVAIKIESYSDGLLWVPLDSEGDTLQPAFGSPFGTDPNPGIPLKDEIRTRFDDVDFIVYIPAGLDKALIEAEIEKYRQALITYNIIQA